MGELESQNFHRPTEDKLDIWRRMGTGEKGTEYVCGFLLGGDNEVALILKNKPDWQKGKFNGIGGKIENAESIHDAMMREFKEEAGIEVHGWHLFCELRDARGWTIHFLYSWMTDLRRVHSCTSEQVVVKRIDNITMDNSIPNLSWLIPMALSIHRGKESAKSFHIQERR